MRRPARTVRIPTLSMAELVRERAVAELSADYEAGVAAHAPELPRRPPRPGRTRPIPIQTMRELVDESKGGE